MEEVHSDNDRLRAELLRLREEVLHLRWKLEQRTQPMGARIDSQATTQPGTARLALVRGSPERVPVRQLANAAFDPAADYVLLERIGEGGMGEVWAARQVTLDRTVAVKLLTPDLGGSRSSETKLAVEAVVAADLEHPNIVPVHELARAADGRLFYSMRRLRGRPWRELIADLPLARNLDILLKLSDAVGFAHERGVLHRDLKPENVLVGEWGEVLLVDWGLAAACAPGSKALPLQAGPTVSGTPAYMPPEAFDDGVERIGPASDIYLLGAILYEILAGFPPHQADDKIETVDRAKRNVIPRLREPGVYGPIALRALATDPSDRHTSVRDFQTDLRTATEHLASLHLVERATLARAAARHSHRGEDFLRAILALEEAVALWPDNSRARIDLSATRRDFAISAMESGDLDLAQSQLDSADSAHRVLFQRIAEARRARDEGSQAVALLDSVAQEHRRLAAEHERLVAEVQAERASEWVAVLDEGFAPDDGPRAWSVEGGTWRLVDDGLRLDGGALQAVALRLPEQPDVRLEAEVLLDGGSSAFLALALSPTARPDRGDGYQAVPGGTDAGTRLLRGERVLGEIPGSLLRGRGWHSLLLERHGARLRFALDGRTVLSCDDPEPLPAANRGRALVAIRGSGHLRRVRAAVLGQPRRLDPLDLAFHHLARGHYTTASDLLAESAERTSDPGRRARIVSGLAQAERLAALARGLPSLSARLGSLWPGCRVDLDPDGYLVDCSGLGIADLAPLAGVPLARLLARGNAITDLTPLAGLPLVHLDLHSNAVTDLAPLARAPLRSLRIDHNRVADLAPLSGRPLVELKAEGNRIASLAPLQGLPLRDLDIAGNPVTSLAPLAGLPLEHCNCNRTGTTDLSPLATTRIGSLNCADNAIADLSPLAHLPLTRLECSGNPLASLAPLTGLALVQLNARRCGIADVRALDGMPLVVAWLNDNRIRDLAPLARCPLESLSIAHNQVERIAPLLGLPLQRLYCAGNPLTDGDLLARFGTGVVQG